MRKQLISPAHVIYFL